MQNGSRPERADFETLDPARLDKLDELTGYTGTFIMCHGWRASSTPDLLTGIPDYFFRTMDLVRAQVGDAVSVHGEVFSPFTHYMELLGYEQALMGLVTDRGKAHALLDRLTEAAITWARAQARHGVDAVLISSAFAGGRFISRKMYSEFVVPYERRVTEAVKADGVPVYTHTCGKIGDRLDLMAETGTQGVDTLDPPPLGNVELAKAKRRHRRPAVHQGQHEFGGAAGLPDKGRSDCRSDAVPARWRARRRIHLEHGLFGCTARRAVEVGTADAAG